MQLFSRFLLGRTMLVSIQEEIGDVDVAQMIDTLSYQVKAKNIQGVIVDLQNVEVMDSYMASHLEDLAATLGLLNAEVVVVGLSVPVVMTLTDFGIKLAGLEFALDVEEALAKLAMGSQGDRRTW